MFTLLENIVNKYNVVLNTKKLFYFRYEKKYIYLNAFLVMALYLSVFLFFGFLLDLNTEIRYLFYCLSLSILATYLIVRMMIEVRFQKQFKLDYKIRYIVLYDFLFLVGIISGILSVVFIFIIPDIATMLDKIIPAVITTLVLLFFFLTDLVAKKDFMTYFFHIIYETLIHALLFFVLQFVINISNPILWTVAYALALGLIYLFKDILSKEIYFLNKQAKSTIQWICFILALLIFLKLESMPKIINSLVSEKVIVQDELVFPGVLDIVNMRATDDYYYVIDSTGNLSIYSKDLELLEYYDYRYGVSFRTIQDELYLYGMGETPSITTFYKIDGTKVELLGEIEATIDRPRDRHFPIIIGNQYYIVYYHVKDISFFNTSEVIEVVSLTNPSYSLDLSITDNLLYEDNNLYISRINQESNYSILTSNYLIGGTNRMYASGMTVAYFETEDFTGLSLARVEDVRSDTGFIPKYKIDAYTYLTNLYVTDDLFVVSQVGVSMLVYDYQGKLLGSIDTHMYWDKMPNTYYQNQLYFWGNHNFGKVLILDLKELNHPVFQTLQLSKQNTNDEIQLSYIEDYHYDWNNKLLYIYFEAPLLVALLIFKKKTKTDD